jgi:hypothetical protein
LNNPETTCYLILYDHNAMTTAASEQIEQLSREELLALVIRRHEITALLQAEAVALKAELKKFRRLHTLVDPSPWDLYWHDQLTHGIAHMFCYVGSLVDVMRANGVLSIPRGAPAHLSVET